METELVVHRKDRIRTKPPDYPDGGMAAKQPLRPAPMGHHGNFGLTPPGHQDGGTAAKKSLRPDIS